MPQSMEEMRSYLSQSGLEAKIATANRLRIESEVGRVISELQADPRWELFGRHIEALREPERRRAAFCAVNVETTVKFYHWLKRWLKKGLQQVRI